MASLDAPKTLKKLDLMTELTAGRKIYVVNQSNPRGVLYMVLYDMGNRPSPSHSIERIDNSKGYEPGNCRWATHLEQMQNTRWNRYVMLKGDRVCVSEAARRLGIKNNRIFGRVRDHGVTHQEAVDYFARLAA